jgi:hypothetical protein
MDLNVATILSLKMYFLRSLSLVNSCFLFNPIFKPMLLSRKKEVSGLFKNPFEQKTFIL